MTKTKRDEAINALIEKGLGVLEKLGRSYDPPDYSRVIVPQIAREVLVRANEGILSYTRIMQNALAVIDNGDGSLCVRLHDRDLIFNGSLARKFLERMDADLEGDYKERVEII